MIMVFKRDFQREDMQGILSKNAHDLWQCLKNAICQYAGDIHGTISTDVVGLEFHRHTRPQDAFPHFLRPVAIIVAQGKKFIAFGDREYRCGEMMCFVSGVNMPVKSSVLEASEQSPYVSMSVYLDPGILGELAAKTPPAEISQSLDISPAAMVVDMDTRLLDVFFRLVELMNTPEEAPVMGDILLRELHYRLLRGPTGAILRTYNIAGSQSNHILKAINWLRKNFRQPLLIETLAEKASMAPSTFHKYFKEITTLSPLQYQKRLRLDEAQRLMLVEGYDVTRASAEVGYESTTQFIREYKRLFGHPPHRNIAKLKNEMVQPDNYIL